MCNNVTNSKQLNAPREYIFEGNVDSDIQLKRDTIYSEKADPFGVYNKSEGLIANDSMAVELSKLILFHIYGKEKIEKERPYQVRLFNDKVWYISGSMSKDDEGGIFNIALRKDDGRVLLIVHSK